MEKRPEDLEDSHNDSKEVLTSRHEPGLVQDNDFTRDFAKSKEARSMKLPDGITGYETGLEQSKSTLPLVTNAFSKEGTNVGFSGKKVKRLNTEDENQKEELAEELEEKSKNLARSKIYRKRGVIIQMLIVSSVMAIYFALAFVFEINQTETFHDALSHIGVISGRTVNLRYTTLFSFNEITDAGSLGSLSKIHRFCM